MGFGGGEMEGGRLFCVAPRSTASGFFYGGGGNAVRRGGGEAAEGENGRGEGAGRAAAL